MLDDESEEAHGLRNGFELVNESRRPACILVIADDAALRSRIIDYLEDYNMHAVPGIVRQDIARQLVKSEPGLVILDLESGQESQFDLLGEIRACSDVPVIIIADPQGDEADRALGLEQGADDYVTKPFGLRELWARIRAVLRRDAGRTASRWARDSSRYQFAGWLLNRRTRQLMDPSGASVKLTKNQYALLIAFLEAPQRPLSREYLIQAVRMHGDILDRTIDVQIARLRRKLETDLGAPNIIRTERGIGYIFSPRVTQPPLCPWLIGI